MFGGFGRFAVHESMVTMKIGDLSVDGFPNTGLCAHGYLHSLNFVSHKLRGHVPAMPFSSISSLLLPAAPFFLGLGDALGTEAPGNPFAAEDSARGAFLSVGRRGSGFIEGGACRRSRILIHTYTYIFTSRNTCICI